MKRLVIGIITIIIVILLGTMIFFLRRNGENMENINDDLSSIDKKRIKWNIEKSIETMFINTDIKYVTNYFYIEEYEKVTPKLFITTIVENYFR